LATLLHNVIGVLPSVSNGSVKKACCSRSVLIEMPPIPVSHRAVKSGMSVFHVVGTHSTLTPSRAARSCAMVTSMPL